MEKQIHSGSHRGIREIGRSWNVWRKVGATCWIWGHWSSWRQSWDSQASQLPCTSYQPEFNRSGQPMLSNHFIFTIQHIFLLPLYDISVSQWRGGRAWRLIRHPSHAPNGVGLLPEDENNSAWSHNSNNILMLKSSAIHSVIERSRHTGYQKFPKPQSSEARPLQSHWHSQKPYSCLTHAACHPCIALLRKSTWAEYRSDLTVLHGPGNQELNGYQDIWGQIPAFCLCFWLYLLLLTFSLRDHLFICPCVGL